MKPCWVGLLALLVLAIWVGSGNAHGIDPLVQDLKTGDEPTRIRAIIALGQSGDPTAAEVLRAAQDDESHLVRQYARHALMDLLRILAHTSRLVTRWLDELLARTEERLEVPQRTMVQPTIENPRD
jgi:HEAT repeat protein